MATIFAKTVTDKTLVLGNREGFLRKFDFGDDWTVIRLLMFMSGINNTAGENTASAAETVALTTSADRIFFGIKNTDSNDLPGVAGSLFVGAMTATSRSSEATTSAFQGSGLGKLAAGGYAGTTLVGGTTSEEMAYSIQFPTITGVNTYCGWYGLQFTLADRGLSTQSFSIVNERSNSVAGTDYSASNLLTLANAAGWADTAETVAWNTGAAARDIPDGFFIRVPFYNNRLRISAIRAIRVS